MSKFKLGEMVRGGPRLRRGYHGKMENGRHSKGWRVWEWDKNHIEGMFIGWRTYYNGYTELVDDEVGYIFVRQSAIKIALIVRTERENPIPVLFDSLEREVPFEHSKAWAIEKAKSGLFVHAVGWPDKNFRTCRVDAIKASSLDEWVLWNGPQEGES